MKEDHVRSVIRAVKILQTLSDGVSTIKDISRTLNFSNSTVHRLLKTLEASNFVTYDPLGRRYYLGPLIIKLASNPMIAHSGLIISAFEEMQRLRDFSGETVALQIRAGIKRLFLEVVPSLQQIKHTEEKGNTAPLYTGSAGKVLLAELPQQDLEKILLQMRIVYPIHNTDISNEDVLIKELEKVHSRGYATAFSEQVQGGAAISVPIRNYSCPVALSIFGPDTRFSDPTSVLEEIKKSADRISNHLSLLTNSNT